MSDKTFNIENNNSGQALYQFGDNNKQVQNNRPAGSEEVTLAKLFEEIKAEASRLPDVVEREQVVARVAEAESLASEAVQDVAVESEADPEAHPVRAKLRSILEALRPHAALIGRCTAKFTSASLKALCSNNPIVAGILAVADEFDD